MKNKVFTFWEGYLPKYIELCMYTWDVPFVLLCYANLHEFTDIDVNKLSRFTLPQIADVVRVHVLRDNGGFWLDADTIVLSKNLPKANLLGDPETRTNSIGFLYTEPYSDMFVEWARHQDEVLNDPNSSTHWSVMGNDFTDRYVREHNDIVIGPIKYSFPETYMIPGGVTRFNKYREFYFEKNYELSDIKPTDLILLHNSWTPNEYKTKTVKQILDDHCTLSNILRERYYEIDY